MNFELNKSGTEQGAGEQIGAQQMEKMINQLKLNELVDLQGEIAKNRTGREAILKKATRAMAAITAGAILMLGTMGSGEAQAGGANVGEASKFGTLDQRIKFNKMEQSAKVEKERTNPNISINGKPGRVIFENDKTTVYGDENTKYEEDSRGNSSMIGGVKIDK